MKAPKKSATKKQMKGMFKSTPALNRNKKSKFTDADMNRGVGSSPDAFQNKYRGAYRRNNLKKKGVDKPDLKMVKNKYMNQAGYSTTEKGRGTRWRVEEQVGTESENMLQNAKDNDTVYFDRKKDAKKYKNKIDNWTRSDEKDKWRDRKRIARKLNQTKFDSPQDAEDFSNWKKKLPSNLARMTKDYDLVQAYKTDAKIDWVDHDKEFREQEADEKQFLKQHGIDREFKRPDFIEERDGKLGAYHLSTRNPETGEYLKVS